MTLSSRPLSQTAILSLEPGNARNVTQSMGKQTHIQCGCGAKINTENSDRIDAFDAVHGSTDHQNKVMEIKLLKAQAEVANNG
jgi:hypothetical protein